MAEKSPSISYSDQKKPREVNLPGFLARAVEMVCSSHLSTKHADSDRLCKRRQGDGGSHASCILDYVSQWPPSAVASLLRLEPVTRLKIDTKDLSDSHGSPVDPTAGGMGGG
jgi:hypothetical protein